MNESLIRKALEAGKMCAEILVKEGGACGSEISEEELPLINKAIAAMEGISTKLTKNEENVIKGTISNDTLIEGITQLFKEATDASAAQGIRTSDEVCEIYARTAIGKMNQRPSEIPIDEDFPMGAIENGRVLILRLFCHFTTDDLDELVQCFDHMANYLLNLPKQKQGEIRDTDAEVERIINMTDEEITAEAGGPEELEKQAEHCRDIIKKAIDQVNATKLESEYPDPQDRWEGWPEPPITKREQGNAYLCKEHLNFYKKYGSCLVCEIKSLEGKIQALQCYVAGYRI